MYRLNPLHRNTLIVTDEVVALAPVQQDVDVRNLQNSIVVAEERFIRPVLGDKMYNDFCAMKNIVVTSGNKATLQAKVNNASLNEGQVINAIEEVSNSSYKSLWNAYLWQLCAECVAFTAIPTNAVKSTSQGEMNNNPAGPMGGTGANSVGLQTLKFKMDKIQQDRIDPLLSAMKTWLCANRTDLPLWDSSSCSDCNPPHRRQTGYVYGVYDDIDNPKTCCD